MKCVTLAWDQYENELRKYLVAKMPNVQLAEDLLHDVFVKALTNVDQFCTLDNQRAWLYRVVKNSITDFYRSNKEHQEIDDLISETISNSDQPVVQLSKCLPTALKKLSADDKEVIELCNLEGLSQKAYAKIKKISLAGAKSRISRAKKKLKEELQIACKITYDEQGNVSYFENDCK